tara:strand:+ start:162 stop:578 length:417 start_codon:yes stop_codon:yes gene_type:complete
MADIEVSVFNQKLKLSYREEEKQRILNAVEVLNNNWNKFSHLHGKVSDLKIATLISLELQDSIENIKMQEDKMKAMQTDNELLKKQINFKEKESDEINKILKKLELELNTKNKESSKFENILDELLSELLEIKNNIVR